VPRNRTEGTEAKGYLEFTPFEESPYLYGHALFLHLWFIPPGTPTFGYLSGSGFGLDLASSP